MAQKREKKIFLAQKEFMINFMEEHTEFCYNKFLGVEGRRRHNLLWQSLAAQLNTLGPSKTTTKWQKAWSDLKNKTKKKMGQMHRYHSSTGGESDTSLPIDDFEERIVKLMSNEALYGLEASTDLPLDTGIQSITPDVCILPSTSAHIKDINNSALTYTTDDEVELKEPIESKVLPMLQATRCSTPTSSTSTISGTMKQGNSGAQANIQRLVGDIRDELRNLVAEKKETNMLLKELIQTLKK